MRHRRGRRKRKRSRRRHIPSLRKFVRELLVQSSVETIRRQAAHRAEFVAFAVAVSAHAARSDRRRPQPCSSLSLRGVFRIGLRRQPLHRFERRRHRIRPRPRTPHLRLQLLVELIHIRIRGQFAFRGIATGSARLRRPKPFVRAASQNLPILFSYPCPRREPPQVGSF